MATLSNYQYSINGVLSTENSVMQNIESLANACGCWVTYDISQGRWSVIINRAGSSIKSFNDTNIIGAISINGTSLTELYNSVRVEFPHIDLRDQKDYISIEIPAADRNSNEPDNQLNIQYEIVTDPVQAELLGLIELKQSRVDQVIKFVTDFTSIGLRAGDLIDVTSDVYGLTNQMYRIISISEIDGDDGSLNLSIVALTYDADVYDNGDITRYGRSSSTGITGIGSIGIPGTPIVNKVETNRKPYVTVESSVPSGIIEGMEFWYTTDTATYDENRTYKLLGTKTPNTGSNVFTYGDTVEQTFDNLTNGNFYIKTRGYNSTTVGPYSAPSGFVYTPVQKTDLVTESTQIQNNDGTSALVNALGVATLINKLSGLFSSNSSAGGLFKTIFDVFNSSSGYDILGDAGNIKTISQDSTNWLASKGAGSVLLFQTNFKLISYNTNIDYNLVSFTAPYTGYYKVKYNINWGGSNGGSTTVGEPDIGETGLKNSTIISNQTFINNGTDLTATGGYSSKYEDHYIEGAFYATANTSITLGIRVFQRYDNTYVTGFGVNGEVTLFKYDQMVTVSI